MLDCMTKKGFKYPAAPPTVANMYDDMSRGRQLTRGAASPSRFHSLLEQGDEDRDDPLAAYLATLSGEDRSNYVQAMGDCTQTSLPTYSDEYLSLRATFDKLRGEVLQAQVSSPVQMDLDKRWSHCMSLKGYNATTPSDFTMAQVSSLLAEAPATQEERSAAIALVECEEEVDYIEGSKQFESRLRPRSSRRISV